MGPTRATSKENEDIERLINKVCANFINQLEVKFNAGFEELGKKVSEACNSIKSASLAISQNSQDISDLKIKIDALEQRERRNSLRLCGFQEEDNEDLLQNVTEFISRTLMIPCSPGEIDYVFRIGKKTKDNPRSIRINFLNNFKRNMVFAAKRILKGSSCVLYEELTSSRYNLLTEAKQKYGKNKAWSSGGKIYFIDDAGNKNMAEKREDL